MKKVFTLFNIQYFTGIDPHFGFAISLVSAQPAVTGEHVMSAMIGHHNLNAVQKPAGTHPFVSVTDHEATDLKNSRNSLSEFHTRYHFTNHSVQYTHLPDFTGVHGENINTSRLEIIPQVVVRNGQHHSAGVSSLTV